MPGPAEVIVGEIIGRALGSLFGGGGNPDTYSATEKRQYLLEVARRYGTSSPEYQSFAKKWPKQARKIERYGLPSSGPAPVVPTGPFSPVVIVQGGTGTRGALGQPYVRPSVDQVTTGLTLSLDLLSLRGLVGLGKSLLARLLRGRKTKKIFNELEEFRKATKSRDFTRQNELKGPKQTAELAKRKADLKKLGKDLAKAGGAGAGVGIAVKIARDLARTPAGRRVLATVATVGAGALVPGSTPVAPGTRVSQRVARSSKGPIGSHTSGRPVGPGGASSTSSSTGTSSRGTPITLPGGGFALSDLLGLLSPFLSLVTPSSSSSRRPLPQLPPLPQPQPGLAPLTGFGPQGVGSGRCECSPKRKKRSERKRRTICYTGRFTETSTGTVKYEKRRRATCQPSRKKPASQRAR